VANSAPIKANASGRPGREDLQYCFRQKAASFRTTDLDAERNEWPLAALHDRAVSVGSTGETAEDETWTADKNHRRGS
jgi:hypothetical protein